MNRDFYFKYIEERLAILAVRIGTRGKLNLLDFNLHAENFYRDFLNLLYGYNLININEITQNAEAIDLFDPKNKILIQVSATATKVKIQSSLDKIHPSIYSNYKFQFVSLAISADSLRKKRYQIPDSIIFDTKKDIHDQPSILKKVFSLQVDQMKLIYELIKEKPTN